MTLIPVEATRACRTPQRRIEKKYRWVQVLALLLCTLCTLCNGHGRIENHLLKTIGDMKEKMLASPSRRIVLCVVAPRDKEVTIAYVNKVNLMIFEGKDEPTQSFFYMYMSSLFDVPTTNYLKIVTTPVMLVLRFTNTHEDKIEIVRRWEGPEPDFEQAIIEVHGYRDKTDR